MCFLQKRSFQVIIINLAGSIFKVFAQQANSILACVYKAWFSPGNVLV